MYEAPRSINTTAIVHRPHGVKVRGKGSRAKRSAPLISQSLRKQSSTFPSPSPAVFPSKIAYLHGAAFSSKSLGGDVNNDRATCTYGFFQLSLCSIPFRLSFFLLVSFSLLIVLSSYLSFSRRPSSWYTPHIRT